MVNSALSDYISKARAAQLSPEQIVQNLHQASWPESDIQQAIVQTFDSPSSTSPTSQPNKFAQMFSIQNIINNFPELLLRFGLAFVFLYAAFFVSNIDVGEKYVPAFVTSIIPITTFLSIFGIFEIILSLWLLSGFFVKYSALLTAFLLVGITIFNLSYFSTLFRNVAIISAALALFSLKTLQENKK